MLIEQLQLLAWMKIIPCVPVCSDVCLFDHALKGKWFELSAPKSIDIVHGMHSAYSPRGQNVKVEIRVGLK